MLTEVQNGVLKIYSNLENKVLISKDYALMKQNRIPRFQESRFWKT